MFYVGKLQLSVRKLQLSAPRTFLTHDAVVWRDVLRHVLGVVRSLMIASSQKFPESVPVKKF